MSDDRLCIICDTRKPESRFEKRGEHIVPRSLGNRKFRTPVVCTECNNGLGGTVDVALKSVFDVALACYDRGVGGGRADLFLEDGEPSTYSVRPWAAAPAGPAAPENPDVKGAVLKIAYEAAHLRLGNNWLRDPAAAAIREVLFAYVCKERKKARELMGGIPVSSISTGLFYRGMNRSRSEHVKHAIVAKSCLNAVWLAPLKASPESTVLAVIFDIEGLPPGSVAVGNSDWGVRTPELLAPRLKLENLPNPTQPPRQY